MEIQKMASILTIFFLINLAHNDISLRVIENINLRFI